MHCTTCKAARMSDVNISSATGEYMIIGTLWTPEQLDSLAARAPADGSEELAAIAASAGYRAGLQGTGMCPYSHRLLRDAWAVGWQAGSGRCLTCGAPPGTDRDGRRQCSARLLRLVDVPIHLPHHPGRRARHQGAGLMAHALYHVQFDVVQRSRGQSAVKVAAYNAADRYDAGGGTVYDFRRKARELAGHAVMLPVGAPAWAADANELWRRAEAAERRCDGQPARLVEFAIPREVAPADRMAFAQAVARPWVAQGMAAQIDIHVTTAADGAEQPHCHVVLTRRRLTAEGFAPTKAREWDKAWTADRGRTMRAEVAARMNGWLEAHGLDSRVDHRRQGGDVPPERNAPRRAVETHKTNPDHPAAGPWRATLEARQTRRQLRAAQRAAAASTSEIAALGAEYDRRVTGLRPRDRRRVPWDDAWLPPTGGTVTAVERDNKGAVIHLDGGGRVLDRGNRLTLAGQVTDAGIDALAEQAARHGWQHVEVTGPPAVRDRLARALAARGITATNHQPPAAPAVLGRHWTPPRPTAAPEPPQRAQAAPRPRPAPAPAPAPESILPTAAPAYRPPWAAQPGRRKDERRG